MYDPYCKVKEIKASKNCRGFGDGERGGFDHSYSISQKSIKGRGSETAYFVLKVAIHSAVEISEVLFLSTKR